VLKKGAGVIQKAVCSSSGGGAASTLLKTATGALTAAAVFDLAARWVIGAANKVTGAVASLIVHSSSPELTAAWFSRSFAPMAALGAALALLVTLIALSSAAARRNPAALAATLHGVVRAGLGTGLVIALTTMGLEIADEISADVIGAAHQSFWSQVAHAWGASGFGGFGSSALAMLMAIIEVIAGVIVWLELAVRNAAIYLAVLFFPVALAASIWPALTGWTNRLARLLLLFVILKPVTLIVLAFAGNAAMAGLSLSGSFASSAGTIIAAVTIFALAAMAPWALMLIVGADAESAAISAGFRAAAGHAASDGAARLRSIGGKLRSGPRRASGGSTGGGGPRLVGGNRPGPGGSGSGPSGGGGGPKRPPGGQPLPTSGSPAVSDQAAAPAARTPRGRGASSPGGAPAVGAVAFAAGLAGRTPERGAATAPAQASGGPTTSPEPGGATRTPPSDRARSDSGQPSRFVAASARAVTPKTAAPAKPGTTPLTPRARTRRARPQASRSR
jgi:hypothetical protein